MGRYFSVGQNRTMDDVIFQPDRDMEMMNANLDIERQKGLNNLGDLTPTPTRTYDEWQGANDEITSQIQSDIGRISDLYSKDPNSKEAKDALADATKSWSKHNLNSSQFKTAQNIYAKEQAEEAALHNKYLASNSQEDLNNLHKYRAYSKEKRAGVNALEYKGRAGFASHVDANEFLEEHVAPEGFKYMFENPGDMGYDVPLTKDGKPVLDNKGNQRTKRVAVSSNLATHADPQGQYMIGEDNKKHYLTTNQQYLTSTGIPYKSSYDKITQEGYYQDAILNLSEKSLSEDEGYMAELHQAFYNFNEGGTIKEKGRSDRDETFDEFAKKRIKSDATSYASQFSNVTKHKNELKILTDTVTPKIKAAVTLNTAKVVEKEFSNVETSENRVHSYSLDAINNASQVLEDSTNNLSYHKGELSVVQDDITELKGVDASILSTWSTQEQNAHQAKIASALTKRNKLESDISDDQSRIANSTNLITHIDKVFRDNLSGKNGEYKNIIKSGDLLSKSFDSLPLAKRIIENINISGLEEISSTMVDGNLPSESIKKLLGIDPNEFVNKGEGDNIEGSVGASEVSYIWPRGHIKSGSNPPSIVKFDYKIGNEEYTISSYTNKDGSTGMWKVKKSGINIKGDDIEETLIKLGKYKKDIHKQVYDASQRTNTQINVGATASQPALKKNGDIAYGSVDIYGEKTYTETNKALLAAEEIKNIPSLLTGAVAYTRSEERSAHTATEESKEYKPGANNNELDQDYLDSVQTNGFEILTMDLNNTGAGVVLTLQPSDIDGESQSSFTVSVANPNAVKTMGKLYKELGEQGVYNQDTLGAGGVDRIKNKEAYNKAELAFSTTTNYTTPDEETGKIASDVSYTLFNNGAREEYIMEYYPGGSIKLMLDGNEVTVKNNVAGLQTPITTKEQATLFISNIKP